MDNFFCSSPRHKVLGFATREGLLPAMIIMVLPFGILAVLLKVFPSWASEGHAPAEKAAVS